jgi:hypothetical protein
LSSSSTLIVVGRVVTWPLAPDPPLRANAHSGGCRVLGSPPRTLIHPLSLSSPVRTSLPPYEQSLVAEGPGAMGIVISPSPSSLSLSCPALVELVLVLVPLALASSSIDTVGRCCCRSTPRAVGWGQVVRRLKPFWPGVVVIVVVNSFVSNKKMN